MIGVDNLDKIENKGIQFTILETMFLEMHLLSIRSGNVRFATRVKMLLTSNGKTSRNSRFKITRFHD